MKAVSTIWGGAIDESICGITIVIDATGKKRAFLGSSRRYSSDESDAEIIARYGNELTVETLEHLIKILKGEPNESKE